MSLICKVNKLNARHSWLWRVREEGCRVFVCLCKTAHHGTRQRACTSLPVKDSSCSDCGSVQSPLSQQCQPLIHQAPAHSLERSLHVGPLIHSPPVSPCNPRRVLSSRHLPLFSTTCNLLMTHSAFALNDRDDVDNGKVYVCGKAGIVVCLI